MNYFAGSDHQSRKEDQWDCEPLEQDKGGAEAW